MRSPRSTRPRGEPAAPSALEPSEAAGPRDSVLAAFSDALLAIHDTSPPDWPGADVSDRLRRVAGGAHVEFVSDETDHTGPRRALSGEAVRENRHRLTFPCTLKNGVHFLRWDHDRPFDELEQFMMRRLARHLCFAARRASGQTEAARPSAPDEGPRPASAEMARLGLTARECEVLEGVVRGKTNARIAESLGVSPRTAGKHMENILAKLGVETRLAAARCMLRRLESRHGGRQRE